ncbi:DUF389 domain-containing protein [Lentilactobacillus curieae]|uniref:DUF389 domain-containing protein n=1 Tax=Lentilactobacillus curieae TaxID=1138822 RepID=A0A1S6QHE0_9LACO|nr:TIGR00341 family protein [Lentilactobacillus curieae]AQW21021.1 DUF389 domain-containing protein [Lentilactobacillus curieae]
MDTERVSEIKNLNTNVRSDLNLRAPNLAILVCAVVVACVGMNMDSSPVVIGAMLISPMMGPIVGMGYAFGSGDSKLLGTAFKLFLTEVLFVLVASTLYFFASPLKELNDQILARTAPTLWDVIIAFFGGLAGIIAASKQDGGNVIPGVAIATALLPPVCTVGFGITQMNLHYILGAGYLFLINIFFIMLATVVGTAYFRIKNGEHVKLSLKHKIWGTVIAIVIAVPRGNYITAKEFKSYMKESSSDSVSDQGNNQDSEELNQLQNQVENKFSSDVDRVAVGNLDEQGDNKQSVLIIYLNHNDSKVKEQIKKYVSDQAEHEGVKVAVTFKSA